MKTRSGSYSFNTPGIFDISKDENKKLPEGCIEKIEEIYTDAENYINGYRKQISLFNAGNIAEGKELELKEDGPKEISTDKIFQILKLTRFNNFCNKVQSLNLLELKFLKNEYDKKMIEEIDKKVLEPFWNFTRSLIVERELNEGNN